MKSLQAFYNYLKVDKEFFALLKNIFWTFIILSSLALLFSVIFVKDPIQLFFQFQRYLTPYSDVYGDGPKIIPESLPHHVQLSYLLRDYLPAFVVLILASLVTFFQVRSKNKKAGMSIVRYFFFILTTFLLGHLYFWLFVTPCINCESAADLRPPLLLTATLVIPWILTFVSVLFHRFAKAKFSKISEFLVKGTVAYWILIPAFFLLLGPFMIVQILFTALLPFVIAGYFLFHFNFLYY